MKIGILLNNLTSTSYIKIVCFLYVIELTSSIPHPIQEADNSTKCEFSHVPTGYLTVGKTISVPGECMLVTCQEDLTITGLTCPTHFEIPGCRLSEMDRYKEYPECCPQIVCKFDKFNKFHVRRGNWQPATLKEFYTTD